MTLTSQGASALFICNSSPKEGEVLTRPDHGKMTNRSQRVARSRSSLLQVVSLPPLLAGEALARGLLFPIRAHVDLVSPAAALGANHFASEVRNFGVSRVARHINQTKGSVELAPGRSWTARDFWSITPLAPSTYVRLEPAR